MNIINQMNCGDNANNTAGYKKEAKDRLLIIYNQNKDNYLVDDRLIRDYSWDNTTTNNQRSITLENPFRHVHPKSKFCIFHMTTI
jgi:hypothetical protein